MEREINWNLYNWWLNLDKNSAQENSDVSPADTILETLNENAAYQENAKVNGKVTGIIASRKSAEKCKVTVIPGKKLCIGDLVYVFGQNWLCMNLYTDEYGMTYGEIWLCNHIFRYQDKDGRVIEKHAIIQDSNYTRGSEETINVTEGKYTCYLSKDLDTNYLYVDKRLPIDVMYNNEYEQVMIVGKIGWMDAKTKNYGKGSHLLTIILKDDLYNPETDNLDKMICDYVQEPKSDVPASPEESSKIFIDGKETIKIGTSRTYSIDDSGLSFDRISWHVFPGESIVLTENGSTCKIAIPFEYSLVGTFLTIESHGIKDGTDIVIGTKTVEVISYD